MPYELDDPFLMPWCLMGPTDYPDESLPMSEKGEEYCNQKARYFASRVSGVHLDWFRLQYAINARFSRGEWGIDEDRPTYLKDGNKIPWSSQKELSIPLAHPMVLRWTGQIASLEISAKATPITQYAVVRREAAKNRAIAYALAAQQGGYVQDATMEMTGYGPDQQQNINDTLGSDERGLGGTYQDKCMRAGNAIMSTTEAYNDYKYLKDSNANTLVCSGMFATHCRRDGMRFKWEWMHPYEMAFDSSSNRADMSDGQFAIHCPLKNLSALMKDYPKAKDQLETMQGLIKNMTVAASEFPRGGGCPQGKPRVMTVYWKEAQWCEMGWMMIDGKPTVVVVNEPDPDKPGKMKYTPEECMDDYPKNRFTSEWKSKTRKGFIERVYFCSFIPWEFTPYATTSQPYKDAASTRDIVLDYGIYDFQEPCLGNPFKVNLPIKFSAVEYSDGYVIAPLTFAISPQRIINQVSSKLVHQLVKSKGQIPWVNPRSLADSDMDVSEVLNSADDGNAIELDTQSAGGAQNAIGSVDLSLNAGFYNLWQIPQMLTNIANTATGMNDPLQGKSTGSQQLVGTTELLLQQSMQMMQPITTCVEHGFRQMHQHDVSAGKVFYQHFPQYLAEMAGDEEMEAIMKSPDMAIEELRADVETTVSPSKLMAATDQMILEFLQLGLIDDVTAAALGGRSHPSDVWSASRQFTEQRRKAAAAAEQQKQKMAMAAGLEAQRNDLQRRTDETYGRAYEMLGKKMEMDQKSYQPFAAQAAKNAMPDPAPKTAPATA